MSKFLIYLTLLLASHYISFYDLHRTDEDRKKIQDAIEYSERHMEF